MTDSPEAKADFARLYIALSRRALGQLVDMVDDDDQAEVLNLFGGDDDLADAVGRHPAVERCDRPIAAKSARATTWPRCDQPAGHDGPHWRSGVRPVANVDPGDAL